MENQPSSANLLNAKIMAKNRQTSESMQRNDLNLLQDARPESSKSVAWFVSQI